MSMLTAVVLAIYAALPAQAVDRPCASDIARLCGNVVPGGGRVLRCLDAHRAELSPACRDANANRLDTLQRHHPCVEDRARLCSHVATGRGEMIACLHSHATELSPACRTALDQHGGDPSR